MSDATPVRSIERPVALREVAYERIRRALLPGGELSSTDRLVERELAEHLSMSRTPVRDALRRLVLSGLVDPLPGGGYVRRKVTLREIDEHYELLAVLEPMATRLAAGAEGEERDSLVASAAEHARDATPLANTRFHVAIAEASGNAVLARVIATLTERLGATEQLFASSDETLDRTLATGHDEILDALRRADGTGAAEAMRRHLEFARREITRLVRGARE
ncbi:MAG: GntR family transcriptional regulator [Candidatus Limnocylindrales bacterium]